MDNKELNKNLLENLNLLTEFNVNCFNKLKEENDKLKDKVKDLNNSVKNLRKRKFELEDKNKELKDTIELFECCESINKKSKKNNDEETIKVYNIKKYRKNKDSYDERLIKNILINIENIGEILKLEDKWLNIRHNEQLQRLFNLIPPLKELDNMIGLEDIKKEVLKKIIYYIQNPVNEEYLHTIISGPPGVGKTQFAKIYSKIFVYLGILKNNKFIEVKRDQLVGEYLGQTAPRTRKVLESALGGVIFIDEAYSLGNPEKRDSFSKESIDMINQYLSEKKNEFMMVVAGYEKELKESFFSFNPGLQRRFSTHYNIKGYDNKELTQIFISKCNNLKYNNTISTNDLENFFKDYKDDFEFYGGSIEQLMNELKYSHSFRTFYEGNQSRDIIKEDLDKAFESYNNNQNKTKTPKYEPPPGLYI
jgi:SpoVK/Ycf46/Vps4 family AAA+-type ATPase